MTQRALRKKISDGPVNATPGSDSNGLIQFNPNLFSLNKFISLPEELKIKSQPVSHANSNGTHLPVKAGTPIYLNHTPVSTSYSSIDKGNNAHLNGTSVVIVKNDESTIINGQGNSKSGCVDEYRREQEKTLTSTSNGHIVYAQSSQNSSISSSNSETSLGHIYKKRSQPNSPILKRNSVDLDLLFSTGDSRNIIGNKEGDKSVDYHHVGDNTEYTGSSLSSSPVSTNQIFESSDPVHFNESTFSDNVVSHLRRGDQFLLHDQDHLNIQQNNYTALRHEQVNHIDSNKTQSTMSSAYIYSTLPRGSGYLVYNPTSEVANMKQRSYSNGDANHMNRIYSESNLLQSKGKFKSLPSLSGSSVSLDKLQRKMEKKREKEEKKRLKEELKRREKEEKRIRKLLKKQGALHMNTLPRNWNYVERPIESVYYQGSNLKLRPVAIDYVDGPAQTPPPPPHQPPPPPQNSQIQDRLNVRTSAIYASAPDLLRVEQVYGTANRRKSHVNDDRVIYTQPSVSVPRTVVLQKGHEGYGFVLRGAKSHSATGNIDFQPTPEFPALQYLDSVDMGSQADRAGLKPGDFILEINGEKVIRATHERVVHLIKSSGARLTLTVVTVRSVDRSSDWFVHQDGSMTLPSRKKQAPAPPRRDPDTSLSYSKARARSMAEGLAEIEKLDQALLDYDKDDKSEYKVASIRARPISKRNTVALEDVTVHANENNHMSPSELRIKKYHRKTSAHQPFERSKSTPDLVPAGEIVNTREIIYDTPMVQEGKSNTSPVHVSLGHSRRDSENSVSSGGSNHHIYAAPGSYVASLGRSNKLSNVESVRHSISTGIYVDSVAPGKDNSRFAIRKTSTSTGSENSTPVPRRPAPPPPKQSSAPELPVRDLLNQEVVKISTPSHSAYANVSADIQKQKKAEETIYESSFRPGTLARLNNNPKGKAVGQQSTQSSEHTSTEQRTKKNSMLVADEISQNSTKHHEEYYEPEPDYESDEDKKRKSAIKHQVLVHTENNMNKTSKGSASPVLSYSVTARKQSETIVSDNTRNSVITSTSHVNNRSPMNNLSNTTSARKPSITVISIGNKDSDTSPRRKSLSSETVLKSSEERAHLGLDNSAINNRRKSGSDSMNGVPFINNYIIPPKPSQPPPAPPVSTIENGHISPPPTEPPPPPPLPPPIPFSEQSTDSHFSQSQKKPQPQSSPLVSLEDIRKAAALRQSRIETEGLKITETTDKPPVVKDGKELKKEQNQAALLAAIAKRREILSKTDENDIVDQIENRLQKTKKLQSAKLYFSSDAISKKNDSPDSPTNSDSVNKSDVTKSNSDKISDQKVFVIDKKQTIPLVKNKTNMKQNVQPPSSENKKLTAINAQNSTATSIKPQPVSDTNGKNKMSPVTSDNKQSDPSSSDFLALAEKARQDWLLKKSQAPKPDSTKGLNVEVTAVKNMGKTSEVNSIKSRIANFESSKSSENQYSVNGSTVDDSVTEDDIRKVSSIAPPPPGFDDHTVHIELVSSSSSYQNEADVNKHVSGFSQDDNSSLVSSLSTLSTLSSEHENNHLDVIAPPPPGFDDSSDIKKSQQPSSELGVKNGKPFNSKPLDTWLCIDVIDWLDDLHLSQYKKSFSQNCIDGKKLLSLNRDGFIELGVNQVGHRMNLERSIKKLTMNSG